MRRIDIAFFTCKCGHRSTPPEAINAFAGEMEVYEKIPVIKEKDGKVKSAIDDDKRKKEVEGKCKGNSCHAKIEGEETVLRIARSYCKATHDKTELAESDHIVLSCPNCDRVLYEVHY